jgi:hypothetical protein
MRVFFLFFVFDLLSSLVHCSTSFTHSFSFFTPSFVLFFHIDLRTASLEIVGWLVGDSPVCMAGRQRHGSVYACSAFIQT